MVGNPEDRFSHDAAHKPACSKTDAIQVQKQHVIASFYMRRLGSDWSIQLQFKLVIS